jgi:hypothetical protein
MPGLDIGEMERVELRPEHVGLEAEGGADLFAQSRRRCLALAVVEGEACVPRRLRSASSSRDIRPVSLMGMQL